jgi:hypothetical protein
MGVPGIFLDLNFTMYEDTSGSDRYPVILKNHSGITGMRGTELETLDRLIGALVLGKTLNRIHTEC